MIDELNRTALPDNKMSIAYVNLSCNCSVHDFIRALCSGALVYMQPSNRRYEQKRMHRTIKAALIVLVSMSIFGFLCNVGSILRFPYAVDYGEAPLMDQATRFMSRQPLYKSDYSSSPYVITNYPPLFVIFLAGVSKLTGANLLLSGRVISVMASIASATLIAILVRSITKNNLSAFIASGLFLGHPYVSHLVTPGKG